MASEAYATLPKFFQVLSCPYTTIYILLVAPVWSAVNNKQRRYNNLEILMYR